MLRPLSITPRMLTLGVLLVSSIACEAEKSRNPLSPSIAGPIAGIALSAPTILSPTNGTLIQFAQQPIELEFNRSVSNGERPFWYEVDVATDREFSTLTHSVPNIEPNRQITEGYTLNVELNANQVYFWRVRALDGANTGNYSESAAFEIYTPLQTSKPTTVSPNDGARVSANTVTLVVENASIAGAANAVHYQFQVATDVGFQTITQSNTVSEGTTTTSTLTDSLEDDTVYFWRSRVIADAKEGQVFGDWSDPASFTTPEAETPTSPTDTSGNTDSSTSGCCPPPNRFVIVQQVANETGYPGSGINVDAFTQIVAERLHAEDPNWGRRINITGPIGKDTVAYKASDGRPYSIDIVAGAGGSNPKIHWDAHGFIGGTWIVP